MTLKADIKYKSNWQQAALRGQSQPRLPLTWTSPQARPHPTANRRNKWICALKASMAKVRIFGPAGDPDAPPEPAIYAQLKGKHRMLFGLANDELGYIIPKRQWDAKAPFCYGLKKDQYGEQNSVGPDAAGVICGTFKDLVAKK